MSSKRNKGHKSKQKPIIHVRNHTRMMKMIRLKNIKKQNYFKNDNNSSLEIHIEEPNLPSRDVEEYKNTRIFPLKVVVINKAPLKGIKILHEFYNSNSNKELVLRINHGNMNSNLKLIIMEPPLLGWNKVKKKKGKK